MGHRITGDRQRRYRRGGWEFAQVCVDDHSRLAYVEMLAGEQAETTAAFLGRAVRWFRRQGIRIQRVLTDNGGGYASHRSRESCEQLGLRGLVLATGVGPEALEDEEGRGPRVASVATRGHPVYVLLNARRHAAKLRRNEKLPGPVRLDPASSARWFDGWRPGVATEEPPTAFGLRVTPAVSRPRTWLLRKGWRRRGLLDPGDVPGTV